MKKIYIILIAFFLININAAAQESFYGEWLMQEETVETLEEKKVLSKEMIKEQGTIWLMKFSEGSKFYQKSNYNAAAQMKEMEGTWKTEPKEVLTIFLVRNGRELPLQFFYEFKGDKMILERYNQLRTHKMVVVFKKSS